MWELDYKESWAPKNGCFWIVGLEKTLESSLECKEILLALSCCDSCGHKESDTTERLNWNWKEISPEYSLEELILKLKLPYLGTWCEVLTHCKRLWCWERLKVGGEVDNRGWDGWMASPTLWTWVWESSRSRWWTGKPGVLQSMGSQRVVRHDWATELNWIRGQKGHL